MQHYTDRYLLKSEFYWNSYEELRKTGTYYLFDQYGDLISKGYSIRDWLNNKNGIVLHYTYRIAAPADVMESIVDQLDEYYEESDNIIISQYNYTDYKDLIEKDISNYSPTEGSSRFCNLPYDIFVGIVVDTIAKTDGYKVDLIEDICSVDSCTLKYCTNSAFWYNLILRYYKIKVINATRNDFSLIERITEALTNHQEIMIEPYEYEKACLNVATKLKLLNKSNLSRKQLVDLLIKARFTSRYLNWIQVLPVIIEEITDVASRSDNRDIFNRFLLLNDPTFSNAAEIDLIAIE